MPNDENKFITSSRPYGYIFNTSGMKSEEKNKLQNSLFLTLFPRSKNTIIVKVINGLGYMPRYGSDMINIVKRSGVEGNKYAISRRFTYLAYGLEVDDSKYNYTAFGEVKAGQVKVI